MLIQETGLQRELNLDETARRTPENEAALLERKIASFLYSGSGRHRVALEHQLGHDREQRDADRRSAHRLLREAGGNACCAHLLNSLPRSQEHLRDPQLPPIAIITSQAAQYSVLADFQLEAQRRAVRALAYSDHLTAYVVAENQIEKLGSPRLAILPSPQSLGDSAWNALLKYVEAGGNLAHHRARRSRPALAG